jgi:hypothetical protein
MPYLPGCVALREGVPVNAVGRRCQQTDHFDWLSLCLNTQGIRLTWRVAVGGALRLACPPTSFPRENF